MANGTIGELLRLHIVLLDEFQAEGHLVFGRLVVEVVDLFFRADVLLRVAVAIEAPAHLQRLGSPHEWHHIDIAMAHLAGDSFCQVDAVVEVDEVRQVVDSNPFQRLACLIACPDRLKNLGVRPDLGVACHAGMCGRDTGKGGLFS